MPRVLVIGYGNPVRGDDGLGAYVVERLATEAPQDNVEFLTLHQLTPELAERLSQVDLAVFIDARYDGEPGVLCCEALEPLPTPAGAFVHYLDPSRLLSWSKALYGACPRGYALSVRGESFGFSQELSPGVMASVPALLDRARDLIREAA